MSRLTRSVVTLLTLGALPFVARAECVSYEDHWHPLGVFEARPSMGFLCGEMPLLYVTSHSYLDYSGLLSIVDAADPAAMHALGAIDLGACPRGMVVEDGVAYVALDPATLQLVDVADPHAPALLGAATIPSDVWGVAARGRYAYVAAHRYYGEQGVYVVDVADPEAPFIVRRVEVGYRPVNILVAGQWAYVLLSSREIRILDLADPADPQALASLELPGSPAYIAAREGYLYVVCHAADEEGTRWHGDGLYVVNASDPAHPWIAGAYAPDENAPNTGIALWNQYAVVGHPEEGIAFIDIADPANPTLALNLGVQNFEVPAGFFATDTMLFAVSDCLMSYDLSGEFPPAPVALVPGTEECRMLATRGEYAYTGSTSGEFVVVDMSDPAAPEVTGRVDLPFEWVISVAAAETSSSAPYVYASGLADSDGFAVIDVADPHDPRVVGTVDLIHDASDLEVEGHRLYAQAGHGGTCIYDISNPRAPLLLGDVRFTLSPQFLTAAGTTLYVGRRNLHPQYEDLYIIDASDAQHPVILGASQAPELPYDIFIVGSLAYIADGDGGLLIMDVGDPAAPAVVSRLRTPRSAMSVWVDGPRAYVANRGRNAGIQVVDVSDPAAPIPIGFFLIDNAEDLELIGGHLLASSWWDPLTVVPLDCSPARIPEGVVGEKPWARLSWSAYPGGGAGELVVTLARAGHLRLTLHDAQGRLVQRLHDGGVAGGCHHLPWSGRDARGHAVATGVYFARAALPGLALSRSLVLVRE